MLRMLTILGLALICAVPANTEAHGFRFRSGVRVTGVRVTTFRGAAIVGGGGYYGGGAAFVGRGYYGGGAAIIGGGYYGGGAALGFRYYSQPLAYVQPAPMIYQPAPLALVAPECQCVDPAPQQGYYQAPQQGYYVAPQQGYYQPPAAIQPLPVAPRYYQPPAAVQPLPQVQPDCGPQQVILPDRVNYGAQFIRSARVDHIQALPARQRQAVAFVNVDHSYGNVEAIAIQKSRVRSRQVNLEVAAINTHAVRGRTIQREVVVAQPRVVQRSRTVTRTRIN